MSKLPNLTFSSSEEIRAFRQKHGMNQNCFWSRVGVTQSGGSRYESDHRRIPRPVWILLTLAYGTDGQARKVSDLLRSWKAGGHPAE